MSKWEPVLEKRVISEGEVEFRVTHNSLSASPLVGRLKQGEKLILEFTVTNWTAELFPTPEKKS